MEINQIIETTIPLWGMVCTLAIAFWNAIKIYFNNKTMAIEIEEEKKQRIILSNRLDNIKIQFSSELENHKKDTDKEFSRINTKLDNQNTTLVEVKTYVKLLVEDKIKKNG